MELIIKTDDEFAIMSKDENGPFFCVHRTRADSMTLGELIEQARLEFAYWDEYPEWRGIAVGRPCLGSRVVAIDYDADTFKLESGDVYRVSRERPPELLR